MRIQPVQPTYQAENNTRHKPNESFKNILNKKLDIDNNEVYDTSNNEVIEDIDHMSEDTLRKLLEG